MIETNNFNLCMKENIGYTPEDSFLFEMRKKYSRQFVFICRSDTHGILTETIDI